MRIYVYDGDDLVARIDGNDEANCVAIFDRYYGSNDYTWDSHGNDLVAVDMELSIIPAPWEQKATVGGLGAGVYYLRTDGSLVHRNAKGAWVISVRCAGSVGLADLAARYTTAEVAMQYLDETFPLEAD